MKDAIALETLDEIAARLTLLEFALEILFAREMASLPEEDAEQAKQAFLVLMARPYGSLLGEAIAARAVALAARFVHKVTERAGLLRTQ